MNASARPAKTALVTGGTSGIGRSIVSALAQRGYHVVALGRDKARGAAIEHEARGGPGRVQFVELDQSDLGAVRDFARTYAERAAPLNLLANVAGMTRPARKVTADGFEESFTVGYLSAVVLCSWLEPLLAKGDNARIINVGAAARTLLDTRLDLSDFDFSRKYSGFKTSLATVHAKAVMAQALAGRLADKDISVVCFNPGVIRSGLMRNQSLLLRAGYAAASFFMAPDSACGIHVATASDLRIKSGHLFDTPARTIPLAFDETYVNAVWNMTDARLRQPGFLA